MLVQTNRATPPDALSTVNVTSATTISGASGTIGIDIEGPMAVANLDRSGHFRLHHGHHGQWRHSYCRRRQFHFRRHWPRVERRGAVVTGNTLNNLSFTGQSGNYIQLTALPLPVRL